MTKLRLHSIFRSTEGEGLELGRAQVFVRLQGCSVGCTSCDSKETWPFTSPEAELEDVISSIKDTANWETKYPIKRVSITGGDPSDPLHEASALLLIKRLKEEGFFVTLEVPGIRFVPDLFELVDFISCDYKTASAQLEVSSLPTVMKVVESFPHKYQIKSVCLNAEDFADAFSAYQKVLSQTKQAEIKWVLTPCYEPDEEFPAERFIHVLRLNEEHGGPFRVIGQQHKWVYGPQRQNV